MQPDLTVIIPLYNAEGFLDDCLSSLLIQNCEDFEIILVDDGSTDSSASICKKYASDHTFITAITQKNQGVSAARNTGLAQATGQWVLFIDADDYIAPWTFRAIKPYLRDSGSIDMYMTVITKDTLPPVPPDTVESQVYDGDEKLLFQYKVFNQRANSAFERKFLYRSPCAKFYRLSLIQKHGLCFDTTLEIGEDALFNLYFLEIARGVQALDIPTYHYRIHESSAMHKYRAGCAQTLGKQLVALESFLAAHQKPTWFAAGMNEKAAECLRDSVAMDFCNPGNPAPYSARRKDFLALRASHEYQGALQLSNLYNFSIYWKLFLLFAKFKWFLPLDLGMKLLGKLNRGKPAPRA